MHPQQIEFVERVARLFPTKFIGAKVLDVGSLDINGNNKRFFYQCQYRGIDISEGPNVDIVYDGMYLPIASASIDTVISTECMEHNKNYGLTVFEMFRVLRPGGLMVMTMAGFGRPEHGTSSSDPAASPHTHDYYKNITVRDLVTEMDFEANFFPFCFEYGGAYDLYFYGIKKP